MLNARRRLAGLALAAACLTATPALCADAPAPNAHGLELSRHLFAEMHMDRMMDGMMKNMMPAMVAQMRKANPAITDEQAQILGEAVTEASQGLMAKVTDQMIPLYASTFTEKELQDLVAFYDGPSGQAMLAKMPILMAKVTPVMAELMPGMTADVHRRVCAKIDCSKMAAPPAPKS